jgi:hypothetical protein
VVPRPPASPRHGDAMAMRAPRRAARPASPAAFRAPRRQKRGGRIGERELFDSPPRPPGEGEGASVWGGAGASTQRPGAAVSGAGAVFTQCCEAVAHMHALSPALAHRDVKVPIPNPCRWRDR